MKGLQRTILASLIIVVLLGTGLLVVLRTIPKSDFIRKNILSSLKNMTGQDVTLGSVRVSLSFPDVICLSLEELGLSSTQGEGLLSVQRVLLTPSLISLIKQTIQIKSIALEGLHVVVRRNLEATIVGGFDPQTTRIPSQETTTRKETEKTVETPPGGALGLQERIQQKEQHSSPLQWSVGSLKIVNAQIDWIDNAVLPDQEVCISLKDLQGNADVQGGGTSFAFRCTGNLVQGGNQSSPFVLDGMASLSNDISKLERIQAQLHAESLKLGTFQPYLQPLSGLLTKDFKLDPLDAQVMWEKEQPATVSCKTAMKVGLQDSGTNELLSLKGAIYEPFSQSPKLDLQAQALFQSNWIRELADHFPEALHLTGPIIIGGTITGAIETPLLDVTGDLTQTRISWVPYLEKAQGAEGKFSLKGKILLKTNNNSGLALSDMVIHVGVSGINLRTSSKTPWLTDHNLQVDSKILLDSKSLNLTNGVVILKKSDYPGEILSGRGSVLGLGPEAPKLNWQASVHFDTSLLSRTGFQLPPEVAIGGIASAQAKFFGTTASLDWSAQVPLTNVDLTYGTIFKKSKGVPGDLSVAGNWSKGELIVSKGNLTLPGLVVSCQGNVRNSQGSFQGLTMDIKRAELKDVWKLVPAASAMGLSGSLEGRIRLTRSEKGIVKSGIIRLVDVEVSPENAGWGLSKVRGPLEIDNDTLQIPEVNGRIKRSVEAPFKVKGKLNHLESLETVNGRLSFELAQGTVKPEVLKFVIPQEQGVLQNLLRTGFQISGGVLDLTTISATFQIQSGVVRTEDFKAKAQSINLGAIGSLHLANQKLDALACVQTTAPQQAVEVTARVLGRIPEVQKLVKQNEGWLKAIGLDKELKRYGIVPPPDTTPDKATQAQATVTPSTIMVRLNGPLSKLEPGIVWESALDKTMITRLKALAN